MKRLSAGLVALVLLPFQNLHAAYQSFPVKTREVIIEDGNMRREVSRPSYSFLAQIISDDEGVKTESVRDGRAFVTAQPGERYSVRLYNPLPIRVGVNLTVDGLNSITGKPSGIKDGSKWIIEPYSFITLRGWQVNGEESRRFFFTDKPKTYAEWRGERMGKDLAANCGVIGAAYFWSQKELDGYYEAHPQYRYTNAFRAQDAAADRQVVEKSSFGSNNMSLAAPAAARKKQEAGTGMGERESHPTQTVDFDFDSGMYRLSQALVIYYDFASDPKPNPFPEISYAPEMP